MEDTKCPHCGRELEIPVNVATSLESYGNTSVTVTKCCGKMVTVFINHYFTAMKSDAAVDAWGNEVS